MVIKPRRALPLIAVVTGMVLLVLGVAMSRTPARPAQHGGLPAPVKLIPDDAFPTPSAFPLNSGVQAVKVVLPELGIDLPVVPGDGFNAPLFKAAQMPGPRLKLPGQGGRSMLYAHARTGMFGPLFQARVGQKVDVTLADGRVLHYTIKEYYPRWPSTDLRWLEPLDHEQLVLLTCTTYNINDPRVVAVAEPS